MWRTNHNTDITVFLWKKLFWTISLPKFRVQDSFPFFWGCYGLPVSCCCFAMVWVDMCDAAFSLECFSLWVHPFMQGKLTNVLRHNCQHRWGVDSGSQAGCRICQQIRDIKPRFLQIWNFQGIYSLTHRIIKSVATHGSSTVTLIQWKAYIALLQNGEYHEMINIHG